MTVHKLPSFSFTPRTKIGGTCEVHTGTRGQIRLPTLMNATYFIIVCPSCDLSICPSSCLLTLTSVSTVSSSLASLTSVLAPSTLTSTSSSSPASPRLTATASSSSVTAAVSPLTVTSVSCHVILTSFALRPWVLPRLPPFFSVCSFCRH